MEAPASITRRSEFTEVCQSWRDAQQKQFVAGNKSLINSELLTEKVRAIAVKLELESLTKSSVNDLGEGLIEVFHGILSDLI